MTSDPTLTVHAHWCNVRERSHFDPCTCSCGACKNHQGVEPNEPTARDRELTNPTLTDELRALTQLTDHFPDDRVEGRRVKALIAALRASREQVEQLKELADFARLLGPTRMVLDRCALNKPGCDEEAADMAQRIVDLIGHPITDEPPHALVERDELREQVATLKGAVAGLRAELAYWRKKEADRV